MARIIWTIPALEDLDEIADYISLDDPAAAKRLVQRVFDRVAGLAPTPNLGPCPKGLRGTAYRPLVIPPLRVFYRIAGDRIYIIYIMRGERLFRLSDVRERER